MKLVTAILNCKTYKLFIAALFVSTTIVYGRTSSQIVAPPVFWNIFNAEVKNNTVLLKWTVTEYNNKAFYIQHSQNGSDWKIIDSINSKNGALTLFEYSYSHINKLEGRQYYRIQQMDIDIDKTGYSEVITVMLRKEKQNTSRQTITLSPNPATDQIQIINEESKDKFYTKANIYDLSGKLVAEKKFETHSNTITISELTAGIYLIRAECNDGSSLSQKIIKQ